jgi:hypothetical protein
MGRSRFSGAAHLCFLQCCTLVGRSLHKKESTSMPGSLCMVVPLVDNASHPRLNENPERTSSDFVEWGYP